MNNYELALVLRAKGAEEASKESVKQLFTKFGATIKNVDEWGRRRLAYEIDGETNGHYLIYTLECDPANVVKIEENFRINTEVLRFMFGKLNKKSEGAA